MNRGGIIAACAFGAVLSAALGASVADESAAVRVAMLTYGGQEKTSVCFSDEFVDAVRYETTIDARRGFVQTRLDDESVFDQPFTVMSGEGGFLLSDGEIATMREYLESGGFLLASAGCSNGEWDESFRASIAAAFPELELERVDTEHALFSTLFEIPSLETRKPEGEIALEVLTLDGRVVLVYSQEGLNDTAGAGGDCCCCGTTEIGNARYVNANILAYALTR